MTHCRDCCRHKVKFFLIEQSKRIPDETRTLDGKPGMLISYIVYDPFSYYIIEQD